MNSRDHNSRGLPRWCDVCGHWNVYRMNQKGRYMRHRKRKGWHTRPRFCLTSNCPGPIGPCRPSLDEMKRKLAASTFVFNGRTIYDRFAGWLRAMIEARTAQASDR